MNKVFILLMLTLHLSAQNYIPMKFSCGKKDTVYVGIEIDSLSTIPKLTVKCTKHNHKEWKSITIGFENGEQLVVARNNSFFIFDEYWIRTTPFNYILFDKERGSLGCMNIRTKDYFINFFNSVQK